MQAGYRAVWGTCVECHKFRETREDEPGMNVNETSHDQLVETYLTQPKTPVRGAQSKLLRRCRKPQPDPKPGGWRVAKINPKR